MNKKDFLNRLFAALNGFCIHPLLLGEVLEELKKSGQESAFLKVLLARLKFLAENGIYATQHKEFEPLEQGIYSMHLSGNGFNIRILYGFLPDQTPALLLAFYERGGHAATDYTGKCGIAAERLRDLEEERE